MAFCTKCGSQVQGPFCGSCGAPAPDQTAGTAGAPAPFAPAAMPTVGPATAQKTSALAWILGGCAGLLVLAAIAGGLTMYFIAHKARQVAHSFESNPALAVTRMIAAVNPDVEVLSVDEGKGMITVRDKKTGKTITMNLHDAQKGKFVFEQDGNKVEMEAHADGDKGSFELKSNEGSMKFGTGAGKMPDWLPTYPGVTPTGLFSMQNDQGANGSFHFTTGDSIDQVVSYYNDAFKKAGMKVNTNSVQQNGKTSYSIVTAEEESGKHKAMVNATVAGNGTNVGITFSSPR
jgi:hypothetical protein